MSELSLAERIQKGARALTILDLIIHGAKGQTVETANGQVPTLATRLDEVESQANQSASDAAAQAQAASASAGQAAQSKTDTQTLHDLVVSLVAVAQAAKDAAEAAYDAMDDRNLGAKPGPEDPATDNDGDPLQVGAWYYNEALQLVRIFKGPNPADWENAAPGASGFYTKAEVDLLLTAKAALAHVHAIADITGLQAVLDAKSDNAHLHNLPDITGLQAALDAKSNAAHDHAFADLTAKPTSIAGFGITDAYNKTEVDGFIATITGGAPALLDTLDELAQALGDDPNFATTITNQIAGKVPTTRTVTGGGLATGGGALSSNQTITVTGASQAEAEGGTDNTKAMTSLRTKQAIDASGLAKLNVENQALSGGFAITEKNLGTKSSGTHTMDVADRPMQYYTNGGAHTLAPGTVKGSCLLDIINNASAGAITTSGFTLVDGDDFTTTNGHKFRCQVTVGAAGSTLTVKALQ